MPELLQDYLHRKLPLAKQTTLRQMLRAGRVLINGHPARRLKHEVSATDKIEIGNRPPKVRSSLLPLDLIFEDADFLVVNKPAGLLTSTVPSETRPTALAIIRQYAMDRDENARVGLIHRLDRDASGLLVFSKSDLAYTSLKKQFFDHSVQRVYAAITLGVPTPPFGCIESRLVERTDGSVHPATRPGTGDLAITHYETLARSHGLAALRVTLRTGRKHQIRAHLDQRGVAILGDPMYGKQKEKAPRMMLAAVVLGFIHPKTGKEMKFEISVPKEFPMIGGSPLPKPIA